MASRADIKPIDPKTLQIAKLALDGDFDGIIELTGERGLETQIARRALRDCADACVRRRVKVKRQKLVPTGWRLKKVLEACEYAGISYEDAKGPCRAQSYVRRRDVAIRYLRDAGFSLTIIGDCFDRDHSTITVALERCPSLMQEAAQ